MKKNKMMRLASLLLVCVLLTTSVISGTYAKYISTATASDVARVAKWDIVYTVGSKDVDITGTNETITFDLFNTVYEEDAASTEEHVAIGTNETIIAPGTGGKFNFTIKNNSEVDAVYTVQLTEANDNAIYIQYRLNETDEWSDDFTDINAKLNEVELDMNGASSDVTVYWRWAFEGGNDAHAGQTDESDTLLGVMAQENTKPSVTVTATITATQVD